MAHILIAGATGLIGTHIQQMLAPYHTIAILTRNKKICNNTNIFYWNPKTLEVTPQAFAKVDCVINLSGENIGNKRWSNSQKETIQQSRIMASRTLAHGIAKYGTMVTTLISASAIGYYGSQESKHAYTEHDSAGTNFMAQTCTIWENEAKRITKLGIRNIIIRTGVVITKQGGMLQKITQSLPFRVIPIFGSGTNNIAWIHIHDLSSIFKYCIENSHIDGVYNAVANNCSQKEFMKAVQKAYGKQTLLLPIPAKVIQALLGEMSEILLTGNTIANNKLIETGFTFSNTDIIQTLTIELNKQCKNQTTKELQ